MANGQVMPTDEQLRERELIAYVTGYDSRDKEVQALREALTYALHVLEHLKADNPNPLLPSARWKSIDMARSALAGGETGGAE